MSQVSQKKHLMRMESELTLFAVDFHAKTSATLEQERAFQASAVACGMSTPDLLANYDPERSSWRTQQLCLIEGLTEFSQTWPRSGMMRSGTAYQLPSLVRVTDATVSGSWPTPLASEGKGGIQKNLLTTRPSGARRQIGLRDVLGGHPNPQWLEWLMGFPDNWTELSSLETQSSHKSQNLSDEQS